MQKTKSPVLLRIISLIFLFSWMGLIFYFSSQNGDNSSDLSEGLIEYAIKLVNPDITAASLEKIVSSLQFIIRKLAHFCIYCILGILSFISVVTYSKLSLLLRFLISLIISVLYSVSDEYHQTFVPDRSGELRDVLIDSLGALTGIILTLIIYKIYKAIKLKRSKKMKKKQYIELTDQLTQRLNFEKNKTQELREENSALNKELFELRQRIVSLENAVLPNSAEAVTEEIPKKEEPSSPQIQLSDGIAMGAKIIGKIVLSSASYCNKLTGVGADDNAKELVNLILGRTEVAKSEILRLSDLEIDPRERLFAMESELNEAEDYFKSVMAQRG